MMLSQLAGVKTDSDHQEVNMDDEKQNQPILLVDAMNLFCRSFAAYPSMTTSGEQIGGAVGFLKTLKRVVSDIRPRRIYVCWESGGSARRRGIYHDYKAQRRPEKLNRFYEDDIPESEENRAKQIAILTRLMRLLPVCQVYVSDCEGDDIIAYLCRHTFKDADKVIMSSDKDLYQLLDEKTRIYSLHKKVYLDLDVVQDEFRIHAKNFALAKAICGDQSDNVPGIKGLGFKTLVKRFPFFGDSSELMIDDVVAFSHTHIKESSVYKNLIENVDVIKRNWQLVYLGDIALAPNQMEKIDHIVGTFAPSANKIEFIRRLIAEGIQGFDVNDFFFAFLCVSYV